MTTTTAKIRLTIATLAAALTVAGAMTPTVAGAQDYDGDPAQAYYHCSIHHGEPCIYEPERGCRSLNGGAAYGHGQKTSFYLVELTCFDGSWCIADDGGFKPDRSKCVSAPAEKPGPTKPGVSSPDSAIGDVGSRLSKP